MKLIITLAVTALLALSTVQALSFQENEELLEKLVLLQQEMEEGDDDGGMAMIATPSNGSESSILQELGLNKRVRRSSKCPPAGPYGGSGGGPFQELPDACRAVVTKVVVRTGRLVDNIQLTYRLSNGQVFVGSPHGGTGGHRHEIVLKSGERITGVIGGSGRLVDRIGFKTSHGQTIGPYGGSGGTPFEVKNCNLRGIFGRSGNMIDSIGVYCD